MLNKQNNNKGSRGRTDFTGVNLLADPESELFLLAVFYRAIEKNIKINNKEFVCLETLLKTKSLNENAKRYILPCILVIEDEKNKNVQLSMEKSLAPIFELLIQHGASTSLVLLALREGLILPLDDLALIRVLVEGGLGPQDNVDGYTLLHAVVASIDHFRWKQTIDYLLSVQVDPNQSERIKGLGTALHVALTTEIFDDQTSFARAKYLIGKLSDYGFIWNIQDNELRTVTILAAKMRATEVLRLLVEQKMRGADIDLNLADAKGRTALHYCFALGNLEGVKLLLAAGASLDCLDYRGLKPHQYINLEKDRVAKILMAVDIDPERDGQALKNNVIDLRGRPVRYECIKSRTEIHLSAQKKQVDQLLPTMLAAIEQRLYPTAALRKFDSDYIKIQSQLIGKSLLKVCIDDQQQVATWFALYTAATSSRLHHNDQAKMNSQTPGFQKLMTDAQAYVVNVPHAKKILASLKEKKFGMALRQAARIGSVTLIDMILDYSATIGTAGLFLSYLDERSSNGRTSLHWSAISANESDDLAVVELLLQYGADVTLKDNDGNYYCDLLTLDLQDRIRNRPSLC